MVVVATVAPLLGRKLATTTARFAKHSLVIPFHFSKDYSPNNKTILEVLTFAYEQKLEVLRYPDCVEGKHPYFNYGEK